MTAKGDQEHPKQGYCVHGDAASNSEVHGILPLNLPSIWNTRRRDSFQRGVLGSVPLSGHELVIGVDR